MVQGNEKLIGELIGLARATDGNEHLITPDSTEVLRRCLIACGGELPHGEQAELLKQVEQAKREMVPDCFLCACPCGKNAAFDLMELASAPEEIQAEKQRLLNAAISGAAKPGEWEDDLLLYQALILIGMDDAELEVLREYTEKLNTL